MKYIPSGPSTAIQTEVVPVRIKTRCKGGGVCYRTFYVTPEKAKMYGQQAIVGVPLMTTSMSGMVLPDEVTPDLGHSWSPEGYKVAGVLLPYERQFQRGADITIEETENGMTSKVILSNGTEIVTVLTVKKIINGTRLSYVTSIKENDDRIITKRIRGVALNGEFIITNVDGYYATEILGFTANMIKKFNKISINHTGVRRIYSMFMRIGYIPRFESDIFNEIKQLILMKLTAINTKIPMNQRKFTRLVINIQKAVDQADLIRRIVRIGYVGEWIRHPALQHIVRILLKHSSALVFEGPQSEKIMETFAFHTSIDSDVIKGYISENALAEKAFMTIKME